MSVDVEQPGDDEAAARVDDLGGTGGDVRLDRRDAPAAYRQVEGRVDVQRGIEDATALDDHVVRLREQAGRAGPDGGPGRGPDELASIDEHVWPPGG